MRVCYFAQENSLEPGASKSLIGLIEQIKVRGVYPIVILTSEGSMSEKLSELGIQYYCINSYSTSFGVEKNKLLMFPSYIKKRIINQVALFKINRIIKREKIDLIHINKTSGFVGARAAIMLNIPFVWHLREYMEEDHQLTFFSYNEFTNLLRKANLVFAISYSIKNKYSVYTNKVKVIYNGLHVNDYIIKRKKLMENKVVKMILVGRIHPGKGQLDALEALNILVNKKKYSVNLTIVGNIGLLSYYDKIKKYINENKLENHVTILPYTENLTELRKNHDIALLCSKKEAFGRVTIESMLSSLLFIGTDRGGTSELVIDNSTGLLYKYGDVYMLAQKIEWSINNKDLANDIVHNGFNYALSNFSIEFTSNKVLENYNGILRK